MKRVLMALAVAATAATATQALAVDEPENVFKYRQNVMKANASHIGAIVAVVKGEVSYTGDVAAHARSLHEMSKLVAHVFPKGTGNEAVADTRALPAIWQDWAKFEAAAKDLETASANLVKVAEAGDPAALGDAVQGVGKACGGCHKPFRAEKK